MPHNHSPDAKQVSVSNFPTDYFKQGQHIGSFKIPEGATQIAEYGSASNTTTILHTVTGGKTLYLSACQLSCTNNAAARQTAYLEVTDADDNFQYSIIPLACVSSFSVAGNISLQPPIEIPAGYKVKITSADAEFGVYGFIHGYEI